MEQKKEEKKDALISKKPEEKKVADPKAPAAAAKMEKPAEEANKGATDLPQKTSEVPKAQPISGTKPSAAATSKVEAPAKAVAATKPAAVDPKPKESFTAAAKKPATPIKMDAKADPKAAKKVEKENSDYDDDFE